MIFFARARAIPHYCLPKDGPRVIATAFHIQTVNNLHSRFASFMQPFCGPATKHLPRYTAWFIARLITGNQTATDAAWNRLLAAGPTRKADIAIFLLSNRPATTDNSGTRRAQNPIFFDGFPNLIEGKLICEALDADPPPATIERAVLVELIEDHLAEARKKGAAGLSRAVRLADLMGQLWRQIGPGTTPRPGWNWHGVDPRVADQLPVPGRHRLTARKRVLSEKEVRALWPALQDGLPGTRTNEAARLVLMLCLALGLRHGAIARCRVADLDLDPERVVGVRDCGPTTTIPALEGRKATAKARREGEPRRVSRRLRCLREWEPWKRRWR